MSVTVDSSEVIKAFKALKANVKRVENPALRKAGEYTHCLLYTSPSPRDTR